MVHASRRASICARSLADTVSGVASGGTTGLPCFLKEARLNTAHQIGMVLASASGKRLPRRVESTTMQLRERHGVCVPRERVDVLLQHLVGEICIRAAVGVCPETA